MIEDHKELAACFIEIKRLRHLLDKAVAMAEIFSTVNDFGSNDFETLRVMKFENFNVHELDTMALDAREFLEESGK